MKDNIADNLASLLKSDKVLEGKIQNLSIRFDSLLDKFAIEQTKNEGVADKMEAVKDDLKKFEVENSQFRGSLIDRVNDLSEQLL